MFHFGEDLFDGIEIGAVRWQEEQPGADAADCGSDGLGLVAAKIIHDDDVSWFEASKQVLFDIGQEAFTIDRPVEDARRCHLITAQGPNECERFPMAMWRTPLQTLAFECPTAQRCRIGFDPSFVNEDQSRRIDPCLVFLPPIALPRDVRPLLFGGVNCFF